MVLSNVDLDWSFPLLPLWRHPPETDEARTSLKSSHHRTCLLKKSKEVLIVRSEASSSVSLRPLRPIPLLLLQLSRVLHLQTIQRLPVACKDYFVFRPGTPYVNPMSHFDYSNRQIRFSYQFVVVQSRKLEQRLRVKYLFIKWCTCSHMIYLFFKMQSK